MQDHPVSRTERKQAEKRVPGESSAADGFVFSCPRCDSATYRRRGSLRCQSCSYVPYHGAD
jgi:deoxyribodipyrimidine photolyase-like uncharacterized protein